jgi:tRNA(fMet)-specific endonuclease VapC
VKYALDTNAVSALMRGDPRVLGRLQRVARADVAVPQPVFAEIAYGIARLPRSGRRRALEDRLELIRSELASAEWTDAVSDAFGEIKAALERKGQRIEDFDAAIAAHAVASDAVLVTANAQHMRRISGLEIEDWAAA